MDYTAELSIDIETYSSEDLTETGVYRYAEAPDFTILLFAYAFDDGEIRVMDLASGEELPEDVRLALADPHVIKTAYNANFERTCLAAYLHMPMPPEQWRCSMAAAAELGLPQTLAGAAEALGIPEQKDARGEALIRYFSKPCKPTDANGGRTRNLPRHAPEKWEIFKEYCRQDVAVERAIKKKLRRFPLPEREQRLWTLDQRILDRGVCTDMTLARNAVRFHNAYRDKCTAELQAITGLENANSVAQMKRWIEERTGKAVPSLDKTSLKALRESTEDETLKRALALRAETAKTSVKKYDAITRSVCGDGRIRGLLRFYGANRTGRWTGRILQVQNLPQNHMPDIGLARALVQEGDYETFRLLYPVPQTLSELIRTTLVPSEGRRFIVSDFSAIEARVIAYLAGEQWRMKVFADDGDIYCASASQMFRVPVEKHGVNGHLRQKGKIAELALGYGGGPAALASMGALEMGLAEEELPELVKMWRASNPAITAFWRDVERAALDAVRGIPSRLAHGLSFQREAGILFIGLPSGRRIAYVKPEIGRNRFGGESITYMGMDQKSRKWARLETWGGKLAENIVQAFARDCLAESMLRLEEKGFEIVFHVHDEVVLDVPNGTGSAKMIADEMGKPIPWAEGLHLSASAFESAYYLKD